MINHVQLPFELGRIEDGWVDINSLEHRGFARAVWRMEEDEDLGRNSPRCEATAEFIVRACNSHYELLQAAEAALDRLERLKFHGCFASEITQLEAAIKKAKGKT
jgi:hypothetical protein